jgi:hypothetical protein
MRRMGFVKVYKVYRVEVEYPTPGGGFTWLEVCESRLMKPAVDIANDVAIKGWLRGGDYLPVTRVRVVSPALEEKYVATATGAQRDAADARNARLWALWGDN